jgi:hypothetical protein
MKFSTIRKAVTAEFGALLLWAQLVPDFHHLARGDYMGLAIAAGTGLGVYTASNAATEQPPVVTVTPPTRSAYVPAAPTTAFPPLTPAPVGLPIPADPPETHAPVAVVPAAPILP